MKALLFSKAAKAILLSAVALAISACDDTVKSETAHSASMNKDIEYLVFLPEKYAETQTSYPAVYLLHGYTDSRRSWIVNKESLKADASKFGVVIVCPDGENSWYIDSAVKPDSKYETFIVKELIPQVEKKFRLKSAKEFRAITGASMGGHGGLSLGFKHPDVFGACGSMSGVVNIEAVGDAANIPEIFGKDKAARREASAVKLAEKIVGNSPAIIFDCGTDDNLISLNNELDKRLDELKIPHRYYTSKGAHDFHYWRKAFSNQLEFFAEFFAKGRAE